jgi:hypothetical protein
MKKVALIFTASLLMISILPASSAAEKLDVRVELGDHPYLPDYVFGSRGALGDVWMLNVEVLDADGDPSEGARVRIYNGKKSVGSGRVGLNGIAEVKFILNKLGAQNLRVIASDDDPSGKGESTFKVEIVRPKTVQVSSEVIRSEINQPDEVWIRPNAQLIMDAGCDNLQRYWTTYTNEFPSQGSATWPFTSTKRKAQLAKSWPDYSLSQILEMQTMIPYTKKLSFGTTEIDDRDIFDQPLGTQQLCQTNSGELLLLK